MAKLTHSVLYGVLGASSGLAGIVSQAGCGRGACRSCFGCVAAGVGVLLVALCTSAKRSGTARPEEHEERTE